MMRELINAQATAVRIACERMTAPHLKALRDSIDRACRVPAALGWDSKVRAHAEIFTVLSAGSDDPVAAPVLSMGAGHAHHLMMAAGRGTDGITAASRRRLLAHLLAGDADAAALEMEQHLSTLHLMSRLAKGKTQHATAETSEKDRQRDHATH
jgi:DNA-binding GntR family transcriptional regulator